MSSTRTQQGQLIQQANSNGFLAQVMGSALNYAQTVFAEGAGVTNHANRLAFARAVALNPSAQVQMMLPLYLGNANIVAAAGTPSSVADSDVDAATQTIWNVVSNYYATSGINLGGFQLGS